jgi:hypothetical protein
MKRRRTKRPEPRTAHLIGLNLTDADVAQLDRLFAALTSASRRSKSKALTQSTVAHQCFKLGLDHHLQGKPDPRRSDPARHDWRNAPKRDAKLVGIYLSETDCRNLIKLDSIIHLRFFRPFRGEKRRAFQFNKPSTLAYRCFQTRLALLLKNKSS